MGKDYFDKYLKYKAKYLNLKNQTGGEKPISHILKNIGLFSKNTTIDDHLNPIYGYLYNETGFIENCYNFSYGIDKNNLTDSRVVINNLFVKIPGNVQPTKILMNLNPFDIGKYLGLLFLYKTTKLSDDLNEKQITINKLKDGLIMELSKLTKEINQLKINKSQILKQVKEENQEELTNIIMQIEKATENKAELNNRLITIKNQIDSEINKLKLDDFDSKGFKLIKKYINLTNNDVVMFRIVEAILWWVANDKMGIKQYYLGINEIFSLANQTLKEPVDLIKISKNYEKQLFSFNEKFNLSKFEDALIAINVNKNIIKIFDQEFSNNYCVPNKEYPDCGETTLRNFLNLLTYNHKVGTFDVEILDKYCPKENLKLFYKIFNTVEKQTSQDLVDFNGEKLTARNAWSTIVMNLPFVNYLHSCDDGKKYEINAGLNLNKDKPNLLQAISLLLPKINKWTDIKEMEIDDKSNNGIGLINIVTKFGKFIMYFEKSHFYIRPILSDSIKIDYYLFSNPDERFYLKILSEDTDSKNIKIDNYLFVKWYPEKYIKFLNLRDNIFNTDPKKFEVYQIIFDYAMNNLNNDLLSQIQTINFSAIDITKYNLSKLKFIKYDESDNSIKSIQLRLNQPMDKLLDNLNNLEYLSLLISETDKEQFYVLLDKLPKLNKLLIDSSAAMGINLEILFSKPDKLAKIKTLTINTLASLGKSLDNFVNLESLTLTNYSRPYNDSFKNLKKLKSLTIIGYIKNFEYSLENLVNLEHLSIPNGNNNHLDKSLEYLPKLKSLTIGVINPDYLSYESYQTFLRLETLSVSVDGYVAFTSLPLSNLKNLILFGDYRNKKNIVLPINIESVTFNFKFDNDIIPLISKLNNLKEVTVKKQYQFMDSLVKYGQENNIKINII